MKPKQYNRLQLDDISPNAFYCLIDRNKHHLKEGFPTTVANCSTLIAATAYYEKQLEFYELSKGYYFYFEDAHTQQIVGHVQIKNIDNSLQKCELGYFVDKDFTRQGIASFMVNEITNYCFEKLEKNKVFICTNPDNVGSQQIAIANGYIKEGILRSEFKYPDGRITDVVYFGKLKTDIPLNNNTKVS